MSNRTPSRSAWLTAPLMVALLVLGVPATGVEAGTGTAIEIAVGGWHTCALKPDLTVWCWGWDLDGQLGDGTTGDSNQRRLLPVQVHRGSGMLTNVMAITAGLYHTCALRTDATVWCWGQNEKGQLGDGTTGDANFARLLPVHVRRGSGILTDVTAISAGPYHTCAVRTDLTVWCWGYDEEGQLGDGTTGGASHRRLLPVHVRDGSGPLTDVKAVSGGFVHTCALRTDGTVWCWGYGGSGALGDGTIGDANQRRLSPVQVRRGSGNLTGVKAISAGWLYTCALRNNATVWCWGDNETGQLGDGTTGDTFNQRLLPVQVRTASGAFTDVKGISAGFGHTCAMRNDTTAWCWGDATDGQLGDGTTGGASHHRLRPVQVLADSGTLTGVKGIGSGSGHSCVQRNTVWCWGSDFYGQLGDGTTGDAGNHRLLPVRALLPT